MTVCDGLTLQLCLVLSLVVGQQFVVWCTTSWHGSLGAHAVRLARQTPSTLAAVRQVNTALFFDVDGGLGSGCLDFASQSSAGIVPLLLFLASFSPTISVLGLSLFTGSCLASVATRTSIGKAPNDFFGLGGFAVAALTTFGASSCVAGIFCFLLLALLLLFLGQTIFDVAFRRVAQDGSLAVVTLDNVREVAEWFAGWKGRGEGGGNAVYCWGCACGRGY